MNVLAVLLGREAADPAARLRALVLRAGPEAALPTERDLATQFGVSRRAVRQALSALEAEGLVWRRQGKGTFAGPAPSIAVPTLSRMMDRTSFAEVMEVRLAIEPVLAGLAAKRATPAETALIRRLAERTIVRKGAEPPAAIEGWDGSFHRAIAEAARNRLFLDLFDIVDRIRADASWQDARERARTPERLLRGETEHFAIVDAIEGRDAETASRVMRRHIAGLRNALGEAMSDG